MFEGYRRLNKHPVDIRFVEGLDFHCFCQFCIDFGVVPSQMRPQEIRNVLVAMERLQMKVGGDEELNCLDFEEFVEALFIVAMSSFALPSSNQFVLPEVKKLYERLEEIELSDIEASRSRERLPVESLKQLVTTPKQPVGELKQTIDKAKVPGEKAKQSVEPQKQPGEKAKGSGEKVKQPVEPQKQPGEKFKQPVESQKQQGEKAKGLGENVKQSVEPQKQPGEKTKQPIEKLQQPIEKLKQSVEPVKQQILATKTKQTSGDLVSISISTPSLLKSGKASTGAKNGSKPKPQTQDKSKPAPELPKSAEEGVVLFRRFLDELGIPKQKREALKLIEDRRQQRYVVDRPRYWDGRCMGLTQV
jgi:hypothetical protein